MTRKMSWMNQLRCWWWYADRAPVPPFVWYALYLLPLAVMFVSCPR